MNPEIARHTDIANQFHGAEKYPAAIDALNTALALLAQEVENQGRLVALLAHGVRRPDAPAPASPHSPEVAALVAVCRRLLDLREPCSWCHGTGEGVMGVLCRRCVGFGVVCEINSKCADLEHALAALESTPAPAPETETLEEGVSWVRVTEAEVTP